MCIRDRAYIIPEAVQHMVPSVLCHRLVLSADARMRGYSAQQVLGELLASVRIPVKLQ